MTQREFWKEIEARTSKEVADFGFESICEEDLPGVTWDSLEGDGYVALPEREDDDITCADLDFAAQTARQAFEAFTLGGKG